MSARDRVIVAFVFALFGLHFRNFARHGDDPMSVERLRIAALGTDGVDAFDFFDFYTVSLSNGLNGHSTFATPHGDVCDHDGLAAFNLGI